MSRIYNNILSNKFDNDNIDNNSNEGNTNHHVVIENKNTRKNMMIVLRSCFQI